MEPVSFSTLVEKNRPTRGNRNEICTSLLYTIGTVKTQSLSIEATFRGTIQYRASIQI